MVYFYLKLMTQCNLTNYTLTKTTYDHEQKLFTSAIAGSSEASIRHTNEYRSNFQFK